MTNSSIETTLGERNSNDEALGQRVSIQPVKRGTGGSAGGSNGAPSPRPEGAVHRSMVFDAHASDTHADPPIINVGERLIVPKLVPAMAK